MSGIKLFYFYTNYKTPKDSVYIKSTSISIIVGKCLFFYPKIKLIDCKTNRRIVKNEMKWDSNVDATSNKLKPTACRAYGATRLKYLYKFVMENKF